MLVAVSTQMPKTALAAEAAEYVWLRNLAYCESRIGANTAHPTYRGMFQFLPESWAWYAKRYGLRTFEDKIESHEHQLVMLTYMLRDPGVNWPKVFPGCVAKIGPPPTTHYYAIR